MNCSVDSLQKYKFAHAIDQINTIQKSTVNVRIRAMIQFYDRFSHCELPNYCYVVNPF